MLVLAEPDSCMQAVTRPTYGGLRPIVDEAKWTFVTEVPQFPIHMHRVHSPAEQLTAAAWQPRLRMLSASLEEHSLAQTTPSSLDVLALLQGLWCAPWLVISSKSSGNASGIPRKCKPFCRRTRAQVNQIVVLAFSCRPLLCVAAQASSSSCYGSSFE